MRHLPAFLLSAVTATAAAGLALYWLASRRYPAWPCEYNDTWRNQ